MTQRAPEQAGPLLLGGTRPWAGTAPLAQSAEHSHGKAGVVGSIPTGGSHPKQKSRVLTAQMLEMPGCVKYPLATVIRPLRPLFSDASRTNRGRRQNGMAVLTSQTDTSPPLLTLEDLRGVLNKASGALRPVGARPRRLANPEGLVASSGGNPGGAHGRAEPGAERLFARTAPCYRPSSMCAQLRRVRNDLAGF